MAKINNQEEFILQTLFTKMETFAQENHVPIINENGRKVFIDIIKQYRPTRVLEIGTAIGYSALLTAYYSNQADIEITSLELSPQRAAIAQEFIDQSPFSNRIEIILGDASENILSLNPEIKYDMIFIDAAKGQYPDYLTKILPLLAPKGVIVADNVLFRGYVRSAEKPPRRYKTIVKRLRQYISMLENNPDFTTTIYENGDGLAVSIKNTTT